MGRSVGEMYSLRDLAWVIWNYHGNKKKPITTKLKAGLRHKLRQTGGPRGLLTLVLSKIHTFTGWWLALGKPGTRFLLDNSKKSHAQNDDPLQPTAATAIDGHVAINRSNVATSPSNPCALLLRVTLPLSRCCSLSLTGVLFRCRRRIWDARGKRKLKELHAHTNTHTNHREDTKLVSCNPEPLKAGRNSRRSDLGLAGSRVQVLPNLATSNR